MKARRGATGRARGATASPLGRLLGTPYDITLHELRVECFFPADAATHAALRRLTTAAP